MIGTKIPELKLISSNLKKIKTARAILGSLGFSVEGVSLELLEIQSNDLSEIVEHKVEQAEKIFGSHIFVEDGGLFIEALNGFPGPYTAYVAQTLGPMGLCKLLCGVKNRKAVFRSALAYVDDAGLVHKFIDEKNFLEISEEPSKHKNSDGWSDLWSILIPLGQKHPYTELSPETLMRWHEQRKHQSTFMKLGMFLLNR